MASKLKIKDKTEPVDNIKIAPFKKNVRKTVPHKHNNYFEIIYLAEGSGVHKIDNHEYSLKPPILFIIRREQVHFWDIKTEPTGFVLIIKKSFVENCLDKQLKHLLSQISAFSCLYPENGETIVQLFGLLTEEYRENKVKNNAIIEGLLKTLLAKLLQAEKPEILLKNSKDNIFQRFKDLLVQEKRLSNKVAHYAKLLNTTPQNLNAVCRKEGNQSATEVLSEFIIGEVKRLLLYTDLTVTEISGSMGFKDNSHFTKYFKRHAGIAPKAFRSMG